MAALVQYQPQIIKPDGLGDQRSELNSDNVFIKNLFNNTGEIYTLGYQTKTLARAKGVMGHGPDLSTVKGTPTIKSSACGVGLDVTQDNGFYATTGTGLGSSGGFTCFAHCMIRSFNGNRRHIFGRGEITSGSALNWGLGAYNDAYYFALSKGNTLYSCDNYPTTAPINKWFTLVGVFDGTDMFLYLNRVLIATKFSNGVDLDASNHYIGLGTTSNNSRNFDGKIAYTGCINDYIATPGDVAEWAENPADIWQPNIRIFTISVVSGNIITANQTEVGDATTATIKVLTKIVANQLETGDSTAATLNVINKIIANQTELGDATTAALIGLLTSIITANQTEVGDATTATIKVLTKIVANQLETGDSTAATLNVINKIVANQTEVGDATTATIKVLTKIVANQTEVGDITTASIVGVLTSTITANQLETGDVTTATINVINKIVAAQLETGDVTTATINVINKIVANQTEVGDSTAASLTSVLTSEITANQTEVGDITAATLNTITKIVANQTEAGDITTATFKVLVQISANQTEEGDVTLAFIGDELLPYTIIKIPSEQRIVFIPSDGRIIKLS